MPAIYIFAALALALFDPVLASQDTCRRILEYRADIAVVDPYSSGVYLSEALRARGLRPISILSTKKPPEYFAASYAAHRSHYDLEFTAHNGIEDMIRRITGRSWLRSVHAPIKLVATIAGSESGVFLNDELSQRLGLPTNGTVQSAARRNKHETQAALRAHGLNYIREILAASAVQAIDWINSTQGLDGAYPVVVKPDSSAATEGFTICNSPQEVADTFNRWIGQTNMLGQPVTSLLVQELLVPGDYKGLAGGEYAVNSVSRNGVHLISEAFLYNKKKHPRTTGGYSMVYDHDELLDTQDPVYRPLFSHAFKAIDAVGLRVGPSHLEIMVTSRGLYVVDLAARLMGGQVHEWLREALGYSSLDLTVDAYDPLHENFKIIAVLGPTPFKRKKHMIVAQLIAPEAGYYTPSAEALEDLSRLHTRSLRSIKITPKPWSYIEATDDLLTSPGIAVFVADTKEEIMQDLAELRRIEAGGLHNVSKELPWYRRMLRLR